MCIGVLNGCTRAHQLMAHNMCASVMCTMEPHISAVSVSPFLCYLHCTQLSSVLRLTFVCCSPSYSMDVWKNV